VLRKKSLERGPEKEVTEAEVAEVIGSVMVEQLTHFINHVLP